MAGHQVLNIPLEASLAAGLQEYTITSSFYTDASDLNSGPKAWTDKHFTHGEFSLFLFNLFKSI